MTEAEPWLKTRAGDLSDQEQRFITASRALADREAQEREAARQRELDLERRRAESDRQRVLWLSVAFSVAVLIAGIATYFYFDAQAQREKAEASEVRALANEASANERLAQLRGEELLKEANVYKTEGNVAEAIANLEAADQVEIRPAFDLKTEKEDVYRQTAILLVKAGEALARKGDLTGAAEKYQAALDLNPPPDTPVYVRVPAGEFTMGSTGTEQYSDDDEKPQHQVMLDEFWILRTEVTNGQYKECVEAKEKGAANGCEPPSNSYWGKETLARWPVTHVTWQQASQYAIWKGGRLPTEAEWEKACRSTDAHIYPWGDELPTNKLANFNSNEGTVTDVGNYVDGQSPYGLLDMAGNVWEWTSSQFQEYPYEADDGREEPTGDADRTLRGGAFSIFEFNVRCAIRHYYSPTDTDDDVGFRFLSPGF